MARAGLGDQWSCLFANDFDFKKAVAYRHNWGADALHCCDFRLLSATDLPGSPDAVWASFPCQDLSLAGGGAGLRGDRSGTFWPFWRLMTSLMRDGRHPTLIVLENVCGTLTSHGGKDFSAICAALQQEDYRCGAVVIDAKHFVPQSRPRLFILGVRSTAAIPRDLSIQTPSDVWHPDALQNAYSKLSSKVKDSWIWWNMPMPQARTSRYRQSLRAFRCLRVWMEKASRLKALPQGIITTGDSL